MDPTTILDTIVRDCQNSVRGLEQNDPHLLAIGVETLSSHCTMVSALLSQDVEDHTQAELESLLGFLQHLRDLSEEHFVLHSEEERLSEGCPHLDPQYVLELRKQGMPWAKIAAHHRISRNSLFKFRKKHELGEPNETLSDVDLRILMVQIAEEHPNAGVVLMQGALLAAGYCVSKQRVWQCLRVIDPVGIAVRQRRAIRRRVYKVKAANYLWHMDSTHKLIMYGFIIHGQIDGYSRRIIYLNVADNNTAKVVFDMFRVGVLECGLPKRVRGDRGVENVRVCDYMNQYSQSPNPFIYGRSVHNIRIERLWKDVNCQVTSVYKGLFLDLEEEEILNINSRLDLLCLAYVYAPRIQKSLQNFQLQWNNHSMRTMRSRTPLQVWHMSMQEQQSEIPNIVEESDDETEGDLNEGLTSNIENEFDKQLLRTECQRVLPDPTIEDNAQGKNLYRILRNHFLTISDEH